MKEISIIIPSNHHHDELMTVILAICKQTVKPAEIIIIDSSKDSKQGISEIIDLCANNEIKLIHKKIIQAFPGHARNIGIMMANSELIAFIDVQTIPEPKWLEESLELLSSDSIKGVWGATSFVARNFFERLIRDGFYGSMPCTTLPGTVSKREIFNIVGQFVYWVRAGEDTEWMLRLNLMKIKFVAPSMALIKYEGLSGMTLKVLLKKWRRNYAASRNLPHFQSQKILLWLVFYPIIILIAFNWNYLIADWRIDSAFYIGHITKIATIVPIVGYFLVRGIILPFKRGVCIANLLPLRFIIISLICLMADILKIITITLPKYKI